jgi:hypothetical protein
MGNSVPAAGLQNGSRTLVSTEIVPISDLLKPASEGQVYAVLDACDAPAVPPKVKELGAENGVSLYRGEAEEDYWAIAPYLVRVDGPLLDWIVATLWEEPWGIFVVAEARLESLRTHFRKFLTVQMPDGGKVYFRFYDPRVLKQFLPTCNDAELGEFFDSIHAYASGVAGDKRVTLYRR